MGWFADRRRRDGRQPVSRGRVGSAAGVTELAHQRDVVGVDTVGKGFEVGNDPVVRDIQLPKGRRRIPRHRRRTAEHRHGKPTLCLFLMIALVSFARNPVFGIGRGVARADDPVLERERPKPEWLEERLIGRACHVTSSVCCRTTMTEHAAWRTTRAAFGPRR